VRRSLRLECFFGVEKWVEGVFGVGSAWEGAESRREREVYFERRTEKERAISRKSHFSRLSRSECREERERNEWMDIGKENDNCKGEEIEG
jgi:hypothetical protein